MTDHRAQQVLFAQWRGYFEVRPESETQCARKCARWRLQQQRISESCTGAVAHQYRVMVLGHCEARLEGVCERFELRCRIGTTSISQRDKLQDPANIDSGH